MNYTESLDFLEVSPGAHLAIIKSAYRRLTFVYHPDHGGSAQDFHKLKQAYDIASEYCAVGERWQIEQKRNLPKWRKDFRQLWREAYQRSLSQQPDAGLHFHTCIDNFRRGYIYPPSEWFLGAIFDNAQFVIEGQPTAASKAAEGEDTKIFYRNHLLRIAPNKRMKESYAKRYWELEFEAKWVFYLPASVELLRCPR